MTENYFLIEPPSPRTYIQVYTLAVEYDKVLVVWRYRSIWSLTNKLFVSYYTGQFGNVIAE